MMFIVVLMLTLTSCDDEYILTKTERNEVYMVALAIEQAAELYCADELCAADEGLTWAVLENYVSDIDEDDYDFSVNGGLIAVFEDGNWNIFMERSGEGDLEFPLGNVPSLGSPDDCEYDTN